MQGRVVRGSGQRLRNQRRVVALVVERLAWSAGIVGLSIFAIAMATGRSGNRVELERFAAAQVVTPAASDPDLSLWSPERIRAWRESQNQQAPPPLAVLRIPKIGLRVAVLEGTDEWTLNRAVGHIEDTAKPGEQGNTGIAGHRDGFFRGLKDVAVGDVLELETLKGVETYRTERTWIVEPEDVSVLDATPGQSITLVTCYPFYFIGSAPQRFIVRATRIQGKGTQF
jgi:sortase A